MREQSSQAFILSITTTALAFLIASMLCVVSIPLFPNERNSNTFFRVFGIIWYSISTAFLCYETNTFHTICNGICRLCRICRARNINQYTTMENNLYEHNVLAYVFFAGCVACQLWEIVNQIYFYGDCFSSLFLVEYISKFCLAVLLLIAMCRKEIRCRRLLISYLGWSIVGAICFSCAFRGVVEEVIQAYIDIVDKSIEDDEYGLKIPPNITSAEQYVPQILKRRARCVHDTIWPWFMENVLENVPFTTEYFSLATFFCVLKWKHLKHEDEHSHPQPPTTNSEINDENSEPEVDKPVVNKWFSLNFIPTLVLSLILITLTILSFVCFKHQMAEHNHSAGIMIFIWQQVTFQLILLISELLFFYYVLRRGEITAEPSSHHQLDIMLLIFPLLPLGILMTLRVVPDIFVLWDQMGNRTHIHATINFVLAGLLFFQVAFQALFIAQVLCQLDDSRRLKPYRSFFCLLTLINACVWFSWTVECKLTTIHGQSIEVYGAVEWTIIVYSTVPFVLFCFAHTTSCFFEIVRHLGETHPPVPLNHSINSEEIRTTVFLAANEERNQRFSQSL